MLGIFAVEFGSFVLILAEMNRAGRDGGLISHKLQWLLLYLFGLMLVLTMFFRMEYTWDVTLHRAIAYICLAFTVPARIPWTQPFGWQPKARRE